MRQHGPKSIVYKGEHYGSLTALAEAHGLYSGTVFGRWKRGWPVDRLGEPARYLSKKPHRLRIEIDGVVYESMEQVAAVFKIPTPTLYRRWHLLGLRGADLVKAGKLADTARRQGIAVTVDGVTYKSRAALAKAYGLPATTVQARYRQGLRGRDLVRKQWTETESGS